MFLSQSAFPFVVDAILAGKLHLLNPPLRITESICFLLSGFSDEVVELQYALIHFIQLQTPVAFTQLGLIGHAFREKLSLLVDEFEGGECGL